MLLLYCMYALLPLAVLASPAAKAAKAASFCSVEKAIVTALKQTSTAIVFCSSFLSISTQTFSTTSTITPAPTTITKTMTARMLDTTYTITIGTNTTITNNVTATAFTGTTTTSTVVATCFSAAYKAPQKMSLEKRGGRNNRAAKPACIPTDWANSLVSSACSCLSITTPSTTLSFNTTLQGVTKTNTATITPTGVVITTYTSTNTVTTYITSTTTLTSTSVVTATSALRANGVKYRQYFVTENADYYEPKFPVSEIQSQTPSHSGNTSEVNFQPSGNGLTYYLTLGDGYNFNCSQGAVLMQGYFVAPETTTYTFSTDGSVVDNWNILWTGTAAYTWQDGSYAYEASRTGSEPITYVSGSTTLNMNMGDAVPMTFLFVNGGYPGRSAYSFNTSDHRYGGDPSSYLVQPCPGSPFQ